MSDESVQDVQAATSNEIAAQGPVMSTPTTLVSIFFEPTETFEALRVRPRFLIAGLITVLLFMAYYVTFVATVGSENMIRAQIESRTPDASPEQIEQGIRIQSSPVVKAITYASFPLVFAIIFAAGAGLYMLGTMMLAKSMTYKQALAVWVYSGYPPMVVFALINIILIFIKGKDEIDPTALNHGLATANLGFLVDPKARPVIGTVMRSFDLIQFYGLFLAAIGLRKVAKLSSGSAWAIVIAIWVLGIIFRTTLAAIFGTAM
jgi:Yip1 domain